jgi:4-hydroxybenzoate polyprenyltransferase
MTNSTEQPRLSGIDELKWGRLSDWLQLVRLPTVFTLLSNCMAATIIAVGQLAPWTAVASVFGISVLAYWAGMILNDCADIDEDRRARPDRPLLSGRISPVVAGHVATGMLMLGPLGLLMMAGYHRSIDTIWMVVALISSILLWISIRAYNSALKHTPLGPILMGGCRGLNILMVGFCMLAVHWGQDFSAVERFPKSLTAYSIAIGLYICGVTTYARREERESSPLALKLGILLQIAGLVVLACLPMWETGREVDWYLPTTSYYPVLIALIGLTVINRGLAGVLHPVSRKVQLAVKHALLSLILIDASVVLMWAGASHGIAVVLLIIPAILGAAKLRTT